MRSLAVYIHWPYCKSKCPYCDFNSRPARSVDHEKWADAYVREIKYWAEKTGQRKISSVFFGGGTPSLMESRTIERVLNAVAASWSVAEDVEITLEANPTSVEAEKFSDFRRAGINRLSVGVQSLRDDTLNFLGREHSAKEAICAVRLAARIFPRFSFDMIYAQAGQTVAQWAGELKEAVALGAKHMSLYQLTIEPNTRFYKTGKELQAVEDVAAELYQITDEIMTQAGLPAYEVSNYSFPGEESRHNLTYWKYNDYIGVGPGAHGRVVVGGKRIATENVYAPDAWLQRVDETGCGLSVNEVVSEDEARREALLMGLRLVGGVDLKAWREKFGDDVDAFVLPEKLEKMREKGFLVWDEKFLRATLAGRLRLNAVLGFIG
ncbi:MAG: radical SAM family heme chaperone HemW [Alphaproteobacteria bacterium]|nr:radical SAM family heme chaperone HemW [Alphaproteobacteria bacterium]